MTVQRRKKKVNPKGNGKEDLRASYSQNKFKALEADKARTRQERNYVGQAIQSNRGQGDISNKKVKVWAKNKRPRKGDISPIQQVINVGDGKVQSTTKGSSSLSGHNLQKKIEAGFLKNLQTNKPGSSGVTQKQGKEVTVNELEVQNKHMKHVEETPAGNLSEVEFVPETQGKDQTPLVECMVVEGGVPMDTGQQQ